MGICDSSPGAVPGPPCSRCTPEEVEGYKGKCPHVGSADVFEKQKKIWCSDRHKNWPDDDGEPAKPEEEPKPAASEDPPAKPEEEGSQ